MAKMTKEQKLEKFKKIFEEAELEFAFPEPVTQKGIEFNVYEEPRFRLTKKQLLDFLKYQDPDDNEVEEYIANHPDEKEWYFDAGLSVRYDLVNDGYNPTVKINDYRDVLENCLIVRYSSEHTDGNLNNPMEIRILDDEILNTVYNRIKEHMEENIKKFNEIVEIKDFSKNLSWSDFTEQDFNRLKTSLFKNIGDSNIDDNIDKVNSSALGDYYGRVKAGDVHIELIPEINMYKDGKEFVAILDNYYYPVLDVRGREAKSPEGINYTYEPGGSFHASEIKDMNYEQFQEYVGTYIYNTIKDSPELLERASKPTIDWNSRETGSPLYNQIYNSIKIKDFTKEDFDNLVNEWAEANSVVGHISVGDIEGDIFFWENMDLTVESYMPALVNKHNLLEAENGYFNYYELSGADEPIINTNNKLRDFNYKNFCKFIKEQWTSQILDNDILLKHAVRDNISWDKYEKLIEKIYDKYTKDWKKTHDYIEGVQEPASIAEFSTNELLEPEIVEKLIGYPDFDLYLNLMETDFREYRKEKELKLQKEKQWETVEQYFPDYHSSSSITLSNDIAAWEEGVNDDFKTLEDFQNRWGKHFESKEMILEYGKRFDELLYKTACAYRDNSPIKEDLLWACEHADYDTLLPSQIDFHINEINSEEKYIRTISYLPEDIVTKLGLETNNKYRILLDTDVAGDLQLFVIQSDDWRGNPLDDDIGVTEEVFKEKTGIDILDVYRHQAVKLAEEQEQKKILFKLNDILKINHSNSMNKSIVIQDSEWGDVLVVTHGKYNGKEGWYYGLFNQHMDISNVEDNLAFYTDEHIHENFKELIEPEKITALDVAKQILIDHQDFGWQRTDSEKDYSEQWLKQTGTELSSKDQQEYLNKLDELLNEKFSKKQVQTKLLPEKYEGYTASVFEPRFTDILNELKPKGMKPFTDEEVKDLFVYTGTDIFKVENGHLNRYYTDTLSNDKLVFQCEGLGSLLKMVEDWSWDSAGNTMKDENDTLDPNYLSNIHFKNRLKEFNREAAKEKLIAGYEGKYYIRSQSSAFYDVLNAFTPEDMNITSEQCDLILKNIGEDDLIVENGELIRKINGEDYIEGVGLLNLLETAYFNASDNVYGKSSVDETSKLHSLIREYNFYNKIEHNPLNFNFSGFTEKDFKKYQERIKEGYDVHEDFYGEVGDIWIHAFEHEEDESQELFYTVFAHEETEYFSDGKLKKSIDSSDFSSKIILSKDFILNSDYKTFIDYLEKNMTEEIFQNENLLIEAQRPLLINWNNEFGETVKNQKIIERKLERDMDFTGFTKDDYSSMNTAIASRGKDSKNHEIYGYFEVGDMRISVESLEETADANHTITLRPEYPGTDEDFNYEASIDGKILKVSYKYDDVDIPCGNLSYEEFKKAVILPLAENLNRNKLNEHVLKDNISWVELAVKKEPEHIVTTSVNFNCGYVFDDDTRNGTEKQKQEVIKAVVETIKDKYEISENDMQIQSFNDMVNIGFAFPVPLEYCYPQDKTDEWVKSIDKQLNDDFGMYVNWEGGERVEDKFNSKEQARDFITKVMEYKFRPNVDYVMSNTTPKDDLYEVQMLTEDEINFFLDNHHEYYPIRDFLNRSYQPKDPVKNLYGNLYVSKNGNAVIDIVSETENGETRVNDYRLDADVPASLMQKYQEAITLYDYKQEREIQFEKYEENGAKLRILKDIFNFTKTIPDFSENDAKLICELMCADPEVDGFSFLKDHFIRKDLQAHVEVNMTVPEVLELCRQGTYDILIDSNENDPEYETLKNNYERINRMSDYFDFGFISNALKNHHDRSFEEQRKLVNDNSKYVHIISVEHNATIICEEVLSNDFELNFSMIPVSGMAENVQKTLAKLTEYSFHEVCKEYGYTEKEGYKKLEVLIQASDYFNNVFDRPRPTAEDIQRAVKDGWSLETALDGYSRFHTDDIDKRLEVIERIDVSNLFESDIEAALQAEKDGIKLIPVEEMDFSKDTDGTYSSYRYTDTEKNREVLKELGFMKQEIELKLGMKFFTASKESGHFLIVGNRTVQKISKDKKMIMDNRGNEYFVDSSEVIYDEKSFDNYFTNGPEKWSTQGGGGWKHFVVNHIDDGMIRIYPANVTEDRYDDIYHVTYFDEPIVNKDVSTWNKAGNLYYADNVNVLKKHLMEQLNIGNLSQNQEMNLKPEQYYEKLCSAMENKDNKTVADCIDNLKDTNNLHHYLDQALFGSITIHDFDTFKKLVENGANIDWKIEDPENAGKACNVLHFAAYRDDARFINYVNEFLNKPRDLLTLSNMLNETDGYDETPFDISFRIQQEKKHELEPYHYNECLTALAEMKERVSDKERMIYQDISTGNYLTVEQSDLLYMIDLYDANKNWLKHDSFEGYIDPETKEDREIKSKYHAGLTAMDDLIREGKWSSRIHYRDLSHNEQLSEELNVSREEGMYVAYRADFNVKIKLAEDELNLQPELLEAALFNNLKRLFGPMDADQREYFYTSTHEDTDFNGNNLYSGNFSLNVPAEYCNPKEKADMWVKNIMEKVKELPGYFSAEKLEVKDDYLENRGAIERYKADRAVLDRFTVKDWNNLVTLNEGFDYSSTMVTDDYSKLTYARLKDNIRRYYTENATPILSVRKLTKLDVFYELDNLDDYYLASTLGKQLEEEDFALEVCNMIVESIKEDEIQIILDSINLEDNFNSADMSKNKITYYEPLNLKNDKFSDCNIEFNVIYDENSNEIYTYADLDITCTDNTNFYIALPDSVENKLMKKLENRLEISGLTRRDLFVHPSPAKGFDKNNQISVNEFALFMQKKGMNIPSETCAIILKYMDFEDYKIYQDFNDNLCIYDNSEDFNGKGEVYTPEQLLEFTKSQIQKAEELGYSNFNQDDLIKINKVLGLNSIEQNHIQRDSSLEEMMNDYDSRSYKNPLEVEVHPVFGEIKKMLPFCKNPKDPCEALNLLCHKWDNEGQGEKKREVLKYISQNTKTDIKSLTAYFENNLNMKVSITPPGKKEPEQSRSKYDDSGLGR